MNPSCAQDASTELPSTPALKGIRVLDIATFVAAPFCGTILADFGAEVIKIEPPGAGDPLRKWRLLKDGTSVWWQVQSRNKRSLALDLKAPEAQAIVRQLAAEADVLIGADGVKSIVRKALFGDDETNFTGMIAWRAVIPMERLPDRMREMVGWTWIGPGGHLVNYPLRGGKLMNMIGTIERDDWQIESWNIEGDIEECARDFSGWHEDVQTLIRAAPRVMKWAFMERPPRQQWSTGRASLLGDAAHATLPFLAQGAVMSIEDGVILGRCLDAYADPVVALKKYEDARVERTSKMVRGAKENTARFHESALATEEGAVKYMESEWSRDPITDRYDWLYRYDVQTTEI